MHPLALFLSLFLSLDFKCMSMGFEALYTLFIAFVFLGFGTHVYYLLSLPECFDSGGCGSYSLSYFYHFSCYLQFKVDDQVV